jgi:hypothetical protein
MTPSRTLSALTALLIVCLMAPLQAGAAQTTQKSDDAFRVGVGVGLRLGRLVSPEAIEASIRTSDSTLQLDTVSTGDLLVSAAFTAYPFRRSRLDAAQRFGVTAVIDLISLTRGQSIALQDVRIEGGVGFAYEFGRNVAAGLTIDLFTITQPRDWVIDQAGNQILDDAGNVLVRLDPSDSNLFKTEAARTLAVWWTFQF